MEFGWLFAPRTMIAAAVEMDRSFAAARALGLTEDDARQEIASEQVRALHRLEPPFDWRAVNRGLVERAAFPRSP